MGGNNEFFENFERNKFWKNYPACKELNKYYSPCQGIVWPPMAYTNIMDLDQA